MVVQEEVLEIIAQLVLEILQVHLQFKDMLEAVVIMVFQLGELEEAEVLLKLAIMVLLLKVVMVEMVQRLQ